MTVVLYHAPPSFYSQVARLVLAEKGVAHEERVVVPGPPLFETYEPWYMRLNPGGTVPTLVIDDEPVDDSRKILHAVDQRFPGPLLTPADDARRSEMERWIDAAYQLPERILAYGSGRIKAVGKHVNGLRRKNLLKHRGKHADMASVYDGKLADIDRFVTESQDVGHVDALSRRYEATLDELDAWLAERTFVGGDNYSLADVVWTVTVSRQTMLGRSPYEGRPHLARWHAAMKARPSYGAADVWEHFQPQKLVPIMIGKLKWRLLAAAVVLTALTAAGVYAARLLAP